MEVEDSPTGQAGQSYFYKVDSEGVFQPQEDHTSQPPWESLCRGDGEKSPTDS